MLNNEVIDLRSALELLQSIDGQLVETNVEVDPMGELSGVYRHVGAGGTVMRPTQEGPAMIFNNIKGHPGARVAIGLLASRKRVGYLLGCEPEKLGFLLKDSVNNPIKPVVIPNEKAKCQEVKYYATDENFDIRKLVPAPTNTLEDAGPYITLGMCYASHPETGESDVTIHRMCFQSKDEISIFLQPGARHIGYFRELAEAKGEPLPISISIGVDPAIEIASCFEAPTTPLGYDELQAALLAFSAFAELKHVFLVDEDVDPFDMKDVMWAMTTRFQADLDVITIPGVQCHPLDPSNQPEYSPHIRARGVACKAIFDCTIPFDQKNRFERAKFMDVDPAHWLPDMFK